MHMQKVKNKTMEYTGGVFQFTKVRKVFFFSIKKPSWGRAYRQYKVEIWRKEVSKRSYVKMAG